MGRGGICFKKPAMNWILQCAAGKDQVCRVSRIVFGHCILCWSLLPRVYPGSLQQRETVQQKGKIYGTQGRAMEKGMKKKVASFRRILTYRRISYSDCDLQPGASGRYSMAVNETQSLTFRGLTQSDQDNALTWEAQADSLMGNVWYLFWIQNCLLPGQDLFRFKTDMSPGRHPHSVIYGDGTDQTWETSSAITMSEWCATSLKY